MIVALSERSVMPGSQASLLSGMTGVARLAVVWPDSVAGPLVAALARPAGVAGVCHGVCVDEDRWDAYDRMGLSFWQHAADSAYNAHYDRPALSVRLA
jgi:hypothetical protein